MQHAVEILQQFGIGFEARVVSAHRMPDAMFDYAESAAARGLRAIIAGAGGAAHLPGMLAAKTTVPVLGVPVASKHLQGVDSLPNRRRHGFQFGLGHHATRSRDSPTVWHWF